MNFYWQFIKFFAEMTVPLTKLVNDVSWWWIEQKQKIFKKLKIAFISEFTLISFDFNCKTILKADSLEYITKSILFQFNNKDVLKSCVYFLKKNSSVKCNYKIYNKKLLIVICCLQK